MYVILSVACYVVAGGGVLGWVCCGLFWAGGGLVGWLVGLILRCRCFLPTRRNVSAIDKGPMHVATIELIEAFAAAASHGSGKDQIHCVRQHWPLHHVAPPGRANSWSSSSSMLHDCVEKPMHFARCHVATMSTMMTGIDHLATEAFEFDDGTMTGIDHPFISWIPSPLAWPTRAPG